MMPALIPATFTGILPWHATTMVTSASGATANLEWAIAGVETLVAIGIATWHQVTTRLNRRIDEEREAERARAEQQKEVERIQIEKEKETQRTAEEARMQARRAAQEQIKPFCGELRVILRVLEDSESEAREQGPLTHDRMNASQLRTLQRRLKNNSENLPDRAQDLRNAVQELSAAVGNFCDIEVPTDGEVTDEYAKDVADVSAGQPSPLIRATALGAMVIAQYRAAADVHDVIRKVRKAIDAELE